MDGHTLASVATLKAENEVSRKERWSPANGRFEPREVSGRERDWSRRVLPLDHEEGHRPFGPLRAQPGRPGHMMVFPEADVRSGHRAQRNQTTLLNRTCDRRDNQSTDAKALEPPEGCISAAANVQLAAASLRLGPF